MRTVFILFTLVCVAFQLSANRSGTQEIKGRVVDKLTGTPLSGVTISVFDTKNPIGTITDENGEFSLWNIPVNTSLKFSFDGYKTVSVVPSKENISGTYPLVIEMETRVEIKKKLSAENLLKGRKTNVDLPVFADK